MHKIESDMSQLAEHARALISATSDAAEDHIKEARARLMTVMENGKRLTNHLRDQASERTRACDLALHENPYLAIGAALGAGVLLSYLAVRECRQNRG